MILVLRLVTKCLNSGYGTSTAELILNELGVLLKYQIQRFAFAQLKMLDNFLVFIIYLGCILRNAQSALLQRGRLRY